MNPWWCNALCHLPTFKMDIVPAVSGTPRFTPQLEAPNQRRKKSSLIFRIIIPGDDLRSGVLNAECLLHQQALPRVSAKEMCRACTKDNPNLKYV